MDICWVYGGYPAGCNDITLARRGILRVLPRGEKIISDKGYKSMPHRIIVPTEDRKSNLSYQHKLIMARHEGVNKRVKDWRCMSSIWRQGRKAHVPTFYVIISLTQINMENGEPLPGPYIY